MIEVELDRLARRSGNYLALIVPETDQQVATLLHRYLCLLFSANIDLSIQLILVEYARRHGSPQLVRYISKRHGRGRNFNTQAVVETLSYFDADFGHSFEEEAVRTGLKEKLDAIANVRNSIAHGTEAEVSRPTLDGYFDAYKRTVALVKRIMLG